MMKEFIFKRIWQNDYLVPVDNSHGVFSWRVRKYCSSECPRTRLIPGLLMLTFPTVFNALTRGDIGDSVALVVNCTLGIRRLSPGEDG